MEGLQSDSDQKALEKAGVNSLDFSNGVRIEPKPHYYGGWWTEYGFNSSSTLKFANKDSIKSSRSTR